MPTIPDVLFVALFAVGVALSDYLVFWPAFARLSRTDPAWARRWLWAFTIANLWLLVGFGAALWMASHRSWASFGFSIPVGWRLWTATASCLLVAGYYAWAVYAVSRSADARANLRHQFGSLDAVLPYTPTELCWFAAVSLTAGFCEEFLYRGYFIQAFSPWLGWWGAAALSLPFFAVAHAYQGWSGIVRTGLTGAGLTLMVAVFQSLWPAIVLHALVDLGAGALAWMALREKAAEGDEPRRPTLVNA